jgi:hypothetical protein
MIAKDFIRQTFTSVTYNLSPKNGKERSEVLYYNQCFGSKFEIRKQFEEIAGTNSRLKLPSMHIILSASPEDNIDDGMFFKISQELAKDIGFENYPYIVVKHTDTQSHAHIHLCICRQSLYKKTALSDSRMYERLAKFCRKIEIEYSLKRIKSPNAFLPPEERTIRSDERKKALQSKIREALKNSLTIRQFKDYLAIQNIKTVTGRGISFADNKATFKGSDLGFSYNTIIKSIENNIHQQLPIEQRTKKININL